ncbi:MAG TPA: hypothetical protein VGT40_21185 [Methylomirabilota bacterium]|nr:hypothetical protein [Methylomirabilota bacterium]
MKDRSLAEWALLGGGIGLCGSMVYLLTIAFYLPEDEELTWEAFSDAFDLVVTGATLGLAFGAGRSLWLRIRRMFWQDTEC